MYRFCRKLLIAISFSSLCLHAQSSKPGFGLPGIADFDVATAMRELYSNFDPKTKSSVFEVPEGAILDGTFFHVGDEVVAVPLRTLATFEGGKRKMILLTYAVPKASFGVPDRLNTFDCHACAPIIGAAAFVPAPAGWRMESFCTVVAYGGGFGQPPNEFRIVPIGEHRIGIEMTDRYEGQGEKTKIKLIMVPWNGKVNPALKYISNENDRGACDSGDDRLPCYSNGRQLQFVSGTDPNYYDILLTLSGSDLTEAPPYRSKSVRGSQRLTFVHGTYKMKDRVGDTTSLERLIAFPK